MILENNMKLTVIEIINNDSNWEWQTVVETEEVDMGKERKEAMALYMGDTFLNLPKEDRDYIVDNWQEETKISNIEI